MNVATYEVTRRVSGAVHFCAVVTLVFVTLLAAQAAAQSQPAEIAADVKAADTRPIEAKPADEYRTLYLSGPAQQGELTDVLNDLRNMLPKARIYGVATQNAISIRATPDEIQLAQRILAEIDRPRKVYRLTYTVADMDDGKRTGEQRYSLIVLPGERSDVKQGTKVPIVTGSYSRETSNAESQTQYLDIGLHIEASIDGAKLHTRVEESSVSDQKSGVGPQDPIVRQTVLSGMTLVPQGKPVVLGSIGVPGTTRTQQVEVAAELVP